MDYLNKIDKYFEFYGEDYSIAKVNGWYYLKSARYNCNSNNIEGLLMAVVRELKLESF